MHLNQVKIGNTVEVRSGFGNGPLHTGVVTKVSHDIKNGYPGLAYDRLDLNGQVTDDSRWCYLDQVVRVVSQ